MNDRDRRATPSAACGRGRHAAKPKGSRPAPDRELATLAKALGHPARIQILRHLLASAECLCGELCEQLPLAQSTVSQHLKILKAAGLIRGTISHPRVCYCANPERLREFAGLLDELRGHELRKSGASPVCIPGPSRPGARGAPRKR